MLIDLLIHHLRNKTMNCKKKNVKKEQKQN